MNRIDDNLESRIVRSLDGELTDDQRLELDRELIRNPEAHRLRDEYAAVDRLTSAALACYVESPVPLPALSEQAAGQKRTWSKWNRGLLAVSGAIAAAILAMVVPAPVRDDQPLRPFAENRDSVMGGPSSVVRPVSTATPVLQRATGRDLMGVVGEDGNIYWIEVERTRTIRLPNGRSGLSGNEL
jgi:anti-sigma factor RsiW